MTKLKRLRGKRLALTLFMIALAILFLMPLAWMISSSLKLAGEVFSPNFHWFSEIIRFDNYLKVWTNPDVPFWRSFLNSAIISDSVVVGQLIVSSLAAYAFAKIRFKGRNIVFLLMLMTMMIPTQALIIPRYMLFYQLGIYDNLLCMILPNFFNVTSIFLLRQFYMGLPDELVEAARIDGAGHFRIWLQIMMPLTKNGLISAAILAFINSWNEYLTALVFLPSNQNYTTAMAVRWYLLDPAREYNLMMCAAASTIVPVIVLYITFQKYFEDGVASSGVKG